MKFLKLLVSVAAVCLLVGASEVMAHEFGGENVSDYLAIHVHSASGEASINSPLCLPALVELKQQGYQFMFSSDQPTDNSVQGMVIWLQQPPRRGGDVAQLFCIGFEIEKEQCWGGC